MTRTPLFFAKPTASRVDGVGYEPLPVDGEPVYVTHPAFTNDGGLKVVLEAYRLQLALALCQIKIKDPASSLHNKMRTARDWQSAKTPIPEHHWEAMKKGRVKWLSKQGLSLDTPIGKVSTPPHPDLQEQFSQ